MNRELKIEEIILFDDISKIDLSSTVDLDGGYQEVNEAIEKYEIPAESVEAVINGLKGCEEINFNDYYKSIKFLKKYDLSKEDCLEIIKNLKLTDYYKNTRSINNDHAGNNLIIFEPELIKLADGRTFKDLIIYLKIDLDTTTDTAVALVSIHDGERNKLPYDESFEVYDWLNKFE